MEEPLLSVRDLQTVFYTEKGILKAVDGVSFDVFKGKTLGIVGESGSGKSVSSLSIMQLVLPPSGKIRRGEILLEGKDLLKYTKDEMYDVRGREISMIFQEPMTSLNPVFTVGHQISEVFMIHHGANKKEAWDRSIEMLKLVGIPSPERRVKEYPHSLSGGMRQRVMIAMALACEPKLLICDEPTTALDVTIQAQILELMKELQERLNMAMIFISHDLGVIADVCDDVMVMYSGKAVEYSDVMTIFKSPKHPYTEALLSSIPKLGIDPNQELTTIPGIVPNLLHLPKGCHFAERCKYKSEECELRVPEFKSVGSDDKKHYSRCVRS